MRTVNNESARQTPRRRSDSSRSGVSVKLGIAVGLALLLLGGCGDKKKDKPATQTAAKVNKEEITVHQINFVLGQQRAIAPAEAASASQQVLERLIDQELALQKAAEQKMDRDPNVLQQVEAARREIISRAYLEKVGQGAPKPTAAEVNAYYEANPALFKRRRIYNLQELNIEAAPGQIDMLRNTLASSKTFTDFVTFLSANGFKFAANQGVRSAEQLPLASVEQFAEMKDGQAVFRATPTGAQVLNLANSQSQPVSAQQSTAAIERYLQNERKRKLVADDLQALRSAAHIEYVGDFAKGAPAKAPDLPSSRTDAPPLTTIAPPLPPSLPGAASQVEVPQVEIAPASMPSRSILDKGLKGMN